ncbi:MAG: substrate-binding domain-containing protein, partial [Flavobacterium sp.]
NVIGLNLKNRKTKTIGVIIPNILNSFFAKVFSGIEKVADKKGYNVITCISNESLEKEVHTLEMLSNGTIDGFILSVSEEAQKLQDYNHFSAIINDGTPIVMFDRIADEVECDKVVVDDFDSALNSTQHLINLGCKNIALISSVDNLSVGKLRADGYLKALKDNNIPINEKIILRTDSEEDMKAKIDAIFENKIDAIFALDENDSVAALRVSLKKGYKVPEDISIIGFADGILASRRLSPSLTTVSQHGIEIGEVAAKRLIQRLEEPEGETSDYETIVIKTKLKERESTRKA